MRFYGYKWNKTDKLFSILILTEFDIENKTNKEVGAGYEILILPSKYENLNSEYLDNVRMLALVRRGEIIYV